MEDLKNEGRATDDVFSKVVRAGRRTYFFDVKATRNNDYYLTLTESKKNTQEDGSVRYEKHKIFLYKEDFEKFAEGFSEAISYVKEHQGDAEKPVAEHSEEEKSTAYSSDVKFEDLTE